MHHRLRTPIVVLLLSSALGLGATHVPADASPDRPSPDSSGPPAGGPDDVVLPVDPGERGPYRVERSDYELKRVKVPGMKKPIEMMGHVVQPAAGAPVTDRPLVLFLHGDDPHCYVPGRPHLNPWRWPCKPPSRAVPNHRGYGYIQRVLASQGYTTVSIRANGINGQDWRPEDAGSGARATIVAEHLEHWSSIATRRKVDMDRVVLVGHGEGGEGVNRAAIRSPFGDGYRIVGQVLLSSTNAAAQSSPYVPTVSILTYCGVEWSSQEKPGQHYVDFARDLDTSDTSLRSAVMVTGANRNYFSTELTPGLATAPARDDADAPPKRPCGKKHPERLSAEEQRAVGVAWVAGAVRLLAEDEQELLPLYDGSHATVASAGDADVRSAALGGGRDMRRPAIDAAPTEPSRNASLRLCDTVARWNDTVRACLDEDYPWYSPHWPDGLDNLPTRKALEIAWSDVGAAGGLELASPLDLRDRRLELRVVGYPKPRPAYDVRLTDTAGDSTTITPVGGAEHPELPAGESLPRMWAHSVLVEPSAATGVDVGAIERVELVGRSDEGRVWVLDLAAAPDRLPEVPRGRLPVVGVGHTTVVEGDGPGKGTVRVPVRIRGKVREPIHLQLLQDRPHRQIVSMLKIAPGQTEASFKVEYPRDNVWLSEPWVERHRIIPLQGAMTDSYFGTLTVEEDEPAPKMKLEVVDTEVTEGERIRLKFRLTEPAGERTWVDVKPVKGPGRPLHTADVPRKWLTEHDAMIRRKYLHKAALMVYVRIPTGDRSAEFSMPIKKDALSEKAESVTFRVRYFHQTYRLTVRVKDRRAG